MYVGMTRAKVQLITFGYVAKKMKSENEFAWLKNVGINNPTPQTVWNNTSFPHEYEEINKPTTASTATVPAKWQKVVKTTKHISFDKRYLSPSKIEKFTGTQYTRFKVLEDGGQRMSTKDWGKDYAAIGSCIHDFFAVYRPGEENFNKEMAQRIINGYGLPQLTASIDEIIESAEWLYRLLHRKFKQTAAGDDVKREVPFQLTMDGQTLRGEMDMLWFYTDENGKQHCILIDYKSFPGVNYSEHTAKYYAQLSAYAHALREEGKDVTHTLLYYPVGKVVHELL